MAIPSMAGIFSSCKSTPSFEVSMGILNLDSMPLNIFTEAFGLQPPWPLWHGRWTKGQDLQASARSMPVRIICQYGLRAALKLSMLLYFLSNLRLNTSKNSSARLSDGCAIAFGRLAERHNAATVLRAFLVLQRA